MDFEYILEKWSHGWIQDLTNWVAKSIRAKFKPTSVKRAKPRCGGLENLTFNTF